MRHLKKGVSQFPNAYNLRVVDRILTVSVIYTYIVYTEMSLLDGVSGFEWDEANLAHIARHNVTPEEAEQVFFDVDNAFDEDIKHSTVEKRFIIIGKTEKGRLLYQIFTRREDKIRVISSRDINKKEVNLYEKATRRTKV